MEDDKPVLYKGESIKDFEFDIDNESMDLAKGKLRPLYDIYKLIVENDILQYDTINDCLLEEIKDYTSKSKHNEIEKQAHKKYFFSVRENMYN